MAISTNQKLTIYRNLYENTGPVAKIVSGMLQGYGSCPLVSRPEPHSVASSDTTIIQSKKSYKIESHTILFVGRNTVYTASFPISLLFPIIGVISIKEGINIFSLHSACAITFVRSDSTTCKQVGMHDHSITVDITEDEVARPNWWFKLFSTYYW